jgi:peptidoglycan/xylan/chitin deacetylase (PgdA/CDA1 family)
LTFDDGLPSQLARAVPVLNEAGLHATFYLNPRGEDYLDRLSPWRDVALAGHEIGNHTISHPCSRAFCRDPKVRGLEGMTLEDLDRDVGEGKRRIQELVPFQKEMTFCYPCYQAHVGHGDSRQSYVPVVARHHIAGRGRGETANFPATVDLHYAWSWPVERLSGFELIGMAEHCADTGRWGILTFHGIHEGHLPMGETDFRELIAHLRTCRSRLWVAPMAEVARRIIEWRRENGL